MCLWPLFDLFWCELRQIPNCPCQYWLGGRAGDSFATVPAETVFRRGINVVREVSVKYKHVPVLVQWPIWQSVSRPLLCWFHGESVCMWSMVALISLTRRSGLHWESCVPSASRKKLISRSRSLRMRSETCWKYHPRWASPELFSPLFFHYTCSLFQVPPTVGKLL